MQFRDFVIELLRQEVDNVFVGLKARMIGPWSSGKTKRSSEVDVDDFQPDDIKNSIFHLLELFGTPRRLPLR